MLDDEKQKAQKQRELEDQKIKEEKLRILAKADEVKGEQLHIGAEGINIENELRGFVKGLEDDPEKKYELYYKGISRLLRKHLMRGKEYEKARSYIYEEKNTFLTRGKRKKNDGTRGADSRMGYLPEHEEMLNVIIKWIVSNGTMVDIFNTLHELNISKGYGKAF
ncbi:MAG: hypothetical protein HGB15_10760 [Chlorobaculum sp.]|nr:hypothetical protein [Chlorobaculum sp.]